MSRQWRQLSSAERDSIVAEVRHLKHRPDWPGWAELGRRYDLNYNTLHWHCDEAYAEKRMQRARDDRRRRRQRTKRGAAYFVEHYGEPSRHVVTGVRKDEVAARLAEIPDDTRSPASRLLGDPVPDDNRRTRYG